MGSEADSSVLSPLSTLGSVETTSKRGRSASSIWQDHTRPARDEEDSDRKYCHYYTEAQPYGTSIATNMRSHLKSQHGVNTRSTTGRVQQTITKQLEQFYLQAESSG